MPTKQELKSGNFIVQYTKTDTSVNFDVFMRETLKTRKAGIAVDPERVVAAVVVGLPDEFGVSEMTVELKSTFTVEELNIIFEMVTGGVDECCGEQKVAFCRMSVSNMEETKRGRAKLHLARRKLKEHPCDEGSKIGRNYNEETINHACTLHTNNKMLSCLTGCTNAIDQRKAIKYIEDKYGFTPELIEAKYNYDDGEFLRESAHSWTNYYMEVDGREFIVQHSNKGWDDNYLKWELYDLIYDELEDAFGKREVKKFYIHTQLVNYDSDISSLDDYIDEGDKLTVSIMSSGFDLENWENANLDFDLDNLELFVNDFKSSRYVPDDINYQKEENDPSIFSPYGGELCLLNYHISYEDGEWNYYEFETLTTGDAEVTYDIRTTTVTNVSNEYGHPAFNIISNGNSLIDIVLTGDADNQRLYINGVGRSATRQINYGNTHRNDYIGYTGINEITSGLYEFY